MHLPNHKTKIVCTIGPASRSLPILEDMIKNGMNIARLNFSHGSPQEHRTSIMLVRQAAANLNQPVSIIIDLPGTKMRVGKILNEPLILKKNQRVTLTTNPAW